MQLLMRAIWMKPTCQPSSVSRGPIEKFTVASILRPPIRGTGESVAGVRSN